MTGTVFREPIICKNIPKLIPGNINFTCVYSSVPLPSREEFSWMLVFQGGQSQYALEDMLLVINTAQQMQLSKDQESLSWFLVSSMKTYIDVFDCISIIE